MGLVASIVGAVTALGAVWAANESRRAANQTRLAAQGQLVASLLDAYSQPEILAAIKLVKSHPKNSTISLDSEVDRARRQIVYHFHKVVSLANAGLLDAQFLPTVVTIRDVELLTDVIEPMEASIDSGYDRSTFERLRRLYSGHPPTIALPSR